MLACSLVVVTALAVVADASLTQMPKFGCTCREGRESLLLNPFSNWQTGQFDVGMWVDIVSASTSQS
jgi:hypothetical protein